MAHLTRVEQTGTDLEQQLPSSFSISVVDLAVGTAETSSNYCPATVCMLLNAARRWSLYGQRGSYGLVHRLVVIACQQPSGGQRSLHCCAFVPCTARRDITVLYRTVGGI